jgi:hypothetical protein
MNESQRQSKRSKQAPEGQILSTKRGWDGLSSVKIDNGIPHTITIVAQTETLSDLLACDLAEIREHLMTRKPGHFRRK